MSVDSANGLVELPMSNYEDVVNVICKIDGANGPVEVSNLTIIGCIGEGLYHVVVYNNWHFLFHT